MKNHRPLASRLMFMCHCVFAASVSVFAYFEMNAAGETHSFSEPRYGYGSGFWGLTESFNRLSLALKLDTLNYIEAVIDVNPWYEEHVCFFMISGNMGLRLSAGMQNLGPVSWQLYANAPETFTVGNGLTMKDFTGMDVGVKVSAFGFNLLSALSGNPSYYRMDSVKYYPDYRPDEHILRAEVNYTSAAKYIVGISGFCARSSNLNRNSLYLLPFARLNMGDVSVYGEAGMKTQWDSDWEREYKNVTAALIGVEVSKSLREFNLSANTEFRYYPSNFTMGFNNVLEYDINYYYAPINNWLYFNNEKWYYANIKAESPAIGNVVFLAGNEIMALDDFSRVVYFYSGGLKWALSDAASFKFLLTNKLPYIKYVYGDCPEFKASEYTSVLLSFDWRIRKGTKGMYKINKSNKV